MARVTFELAKRQRGILELVNDGSPDYGPTLTYGEMGKDGLGEFVDVRRDAGLLTVRVRDPKEIELVKAVRDMHTKHLEKHRLLEHYAGKEPKKFIQVDGFSEVKFGDCVMHPDADDDCMMCGSTTELMQGTDVRILIPEGASGVVVCRLLRKMVSFVEECFGDATIGRIAPPPSCVEGVATEASG
jgi:hypothetical protein